MMEIGRYFANPYRDRNITDKRFFNYLGDHIQHLKANNEGGRHDAMLAKLEPLHAAMDADMSREDVSRVERIGKTRSVDQLVDLFEDDVRRYEGSVKSAFGLDSENYIKFFPAGQTEYNNITRTDAPTLFQRWDALTGKHKDDFAPAVVTLFSTYYDRYKTLREEQQKLQTNVEDADDDVTASRLAAELGMVESLHRIGAMFPGQEARCSSYFNTSLLMPRGGSGEEEVEAPKPV